MNTKTNRLAQALMALFAIAVAVGAVASWRQLMLPKYAISVIQNLIVLSHNELQPDPTKLRRNVSLIVKNDGRRPFRLIHVESTCSCSVPDTFSGEALQSGEQSTIPLIFSLPPFGRKQSRLTLTTDAKEIPPVVVNVELRGPDHPVPMIEPFSRSFQFTTSSLNEKVTERLNFQTVEVFGSPPWLQGFAPSLQSAKVNRLSVTTIAEDEKRKIVRRNYEFEVEFTGPQSEDEIVHFWITERTSSKPSSRPVLPSFRCTLSGAFTDTSN